MFLSEKKISMNGMEQALKQTDAKISVEEPAASKMQCQLDQPHSDNSFHFSRNKKEAFLLEDLTPAKNDNGELEDNQPSSILLPQPAVLEPKPEISNNHISEKISQQCNGNIHGRNAHMSSELFEMEPDTMEFKPVTTAGPPRSSPFITAVRHTKSQLPTTTDHVTLLNDIQNITIPVDSKKDEIVKEEKTEEHKSLSPLQPKKEEVLAKHSEPDTPVSKVCPSSADLALKTEDEKPPNRFSLRTWSQRNGTSPGPPLSKGVSLSHENLKSQLRNENDAVTVTSATTLTAPPPSSVAMRGSISMDPKDSFVIGRSFYSRSTSGRLPASALRGKIQDMPWYLTRSQEILGTVALSSDKLADNKASKDAADRKDCKKESPKSTSVPALNDWKEKDAEVVVVKLKDGPQEVASHVKDTSGKTPLSGQPDLKQNGLQDSTELFSRLGTCRSEQPKSQKNPGTKDNLERPSPPSSTGTPHRDACGCHTVYANCFGDSEDLCGFDDDLTVYEFSRQKRINKPPQTSTAPCSAPSSNILSLLRDSPHPLSSSSELSPLFSPPRPRPLGYSMLDNPLRDLQERRYVAGLKGTGLKGGYMSLHKDIDELLLVLKNGETAINPPGQKGQCEQASSMNGNSFSETERCLVQAEARRLASGCQRATRVGWAPDDALLSLGNSFGALVHLAAACLQVSCSDCGSCHGDIDGTEALRKLQEIVCLYKEFVVAVEAAREGEGVRLLAKQCTVLISTVFSLTQLFRTHTPDTDNRHLALNF